MEFLEGCSSFASSNLYIMKNQVYFYVLIAMFPILINAQVQEWKNERELGLVFGLIQPLFASGFNIEGVYAHKRLIFNYSHGMSLDFKGDLLPETVRNQSLEIHMPFTTGFGVGYRFTHWLNLRVEPKWHRFNFYYENEAQTNENLAASHNTFSLGLGLYGLWKPFKKQDSWLKGFTVAPSLRYWPNVVSDFEPNGFTYQNRLTEQEEKLSSLQPGIGFTPFILNVSIGYLIPLK